MLDLLYNILIYPLEFVMSVVVDSGDKLFGYLGGITLLSFLVSLLLHPIKNWAKKFHNREKQIQYKMQPALIEAKQKYRGAEQYKKINAIYEHNNYHPIHSIRGLVGFVVQLPFFISGFVLLYSYKPIDAIFYGLDLTKTDELLGGINILPVIMVIVNILLAVYYDIDDWFERYGLPVLFFILLYTMPAGLVIYWTLNLLFGFIVPILSKRLKL